MRVRVCGVAGEAVRGASGPGEARSASTEAKGLGPDWQIEDLFSETSYRVGIRGWATALDQGSGSWRRSAERKRPCGMSGGDHRDLGGRDRTDGRLHAGPELKREEGQASPDSALVCRGVALGGVSAPVYVKKKNLAAQQLKWQSLLFCSHRDPRLHGKIGRCRSGSRRLVSNRSGPRLLFRSWRHVTRRLALMADEDVASEFCGPVNRYRMARHISRMGRQRRRSEARRKRRRRRPQADQFCSLGPYLKDRQGRRLPHATLWITVTDDATIPRNCLYAPGTGATGHSPALRDVYEFKGTRAETILTPPDRSELEPQRLSACLASTSSRISSWRLTRNASLCRFPRASARHASPVTAYIPTNVEHDTVGRSNTFVVYASRSNVINAHASSLDKKRRRVDRTGVLCQSFHRRSLSATASL